jgi:hypothetical protein
MAKATISLLDCGLHISINLEIDGETRTYVTTKDDLLSEIPSLEGRFDIVLHNLKTNIKVSGETDWGKIVSSINTKEFKV